MAKKFNCTEGTDENVSFGGFRLDETMRLAFLKPANVQNRITVAYEASNGKSYVQNIKCVVIYSDGTLAPHALDWGAIKEMSTTLIDGQTAPHAKSPLTDELRTSQNPFNIFKELFENNTIVQLEKVYTGRRRFGDKEYNVPFYGLARTDEKYAQTDTEITIGEHSLTFEQINKFFQEYEDRRNKKN